MFMAFLFCCSGCGWGNRLVSCHVLSCHVVSCPVMSSAVMSSAVISYRLLSCPVLSSPVMSCRVMSSDMTWGLECRTFCLVGERVQWHCRAGTALQGRRGIAGQTWQHRLSKRLQVWKISILNFHNHGAGGPAGMTLGGHAWLYPANIRSLCSGRGFVDVEG